MGPLAFMMMILGCADGGDACTEARTVPVAYISREACLTAQADALMRNSDLPFPQIRAECRAATPQFTRHIQQQGRTAG